MMMHVGDAYCLLSYFQEQCKENSNFYFKYVVDEENICAGIFGLMHNHSWIMNVLVISWHLIRLTTQMLIENPLLC